MTSAECFDKYGAEWTDEDAPTPDDMAEDREPPISMSDRKAEHAERTAQGPMLMGDGLD